MNRDFRIAISNKRICILILQILCLCLYGCAAFRMDNTFRIAILVVFVIIIMISFMSFFKSKYVITDGEILVDFYSDEKRNYFIEKITKIAYIDTSSKWRPFSAEPRHQLAIYFERSYLKSVEPRNFFPADRDAFVDAILKVKPDICVQRTEMKFKTFLIG